MTQATCATEEALVAFCALVRAEGARLYRDLPWRNTRDPWLVLLSEVMLQQTQVSRVLRHWSRFSAAFPTAEALAAASTTDVLSFWQGLGYNRRALALKRAAERIAYDHKGTIPATRDTLLTLPGVGPATASGVCIFAFNEPQVYLETNVRAVFLHHFFTESALLFDPSGSSTAGPTADPQPAQTPGSQPDAKRGPTPGSQPDAERGPVPDSQPDATRGPVHDREIIPLIEATCDRVDPRGWYYALLDYGNHLKKTLPNPSRASKHHTRQSRFEGSVRQKRAWLLRELLALGEATTEELCVSLNRAEHRASRPDLSLEELQAILTALASEGFIVEQAKGWTIRG
ncbi:MAG: adenine glycosylase [Coriobacteriales bacterium]|jgi:A/G-specific adenine glycosylase|nr:adenine glycosylase [Coriobacteriales bacterium]